MWRRFSTSSGWHMPSIGRPHRYRWICGKGNGKLIHLSLLDSSPKPCRGRNHGKVDILFPYSQKTSSHHFIYHRSCGQIWDFDSQGLANVTWSFAVLGFKCQGPRVKSGRSSPSSPPCGFEPMTEVPSSQMRS